METESGGVLTLREARRQQTRRHILAAAGELFSQQGFVDTTISDIADAAGASRATIYAYFDSKDEIATAIVNQLWDVAQEMYDEFGRLTEWSTASLRGWVEYVVQRWDENAPMARMQLSRVAGYEHMYTERHHSYIDGLTTNRELWSRFSDDEARRRALILIGGLHVFMNAWIARGWPMDRAGAIDTLTGVWAAVLQAD